MYGAEARYPLTPIGTGIATRVYRNAAGETIRVDDITIAFSARAREVLTQSHENAFLVSHKRSISTTRLYPGPASSRVVGEILFLGNFAETVEAGGDFTSATWTFNDNDCEVLFDDLPGVGDSVD